MHLATLLLACASVVPWLSSTEATPPQETPAELQARLAWFREARFGMFIHWGVYSVPAGEWTDNNNHGEWFLKSTNIPLSQYVHYAQQFNPTKFDAKQWVRIAQDAGMKYLVITSKHHDGFCLFPSKLTDWDIGATPFKRDPLAELAAACKEAGIRFCTYHSIMDWHHADWGKRLANNDSAAGTPDMDRFTAYLKGQLAEIITAYRPGIMWFDGEWEDPWTHARGVDLYAYLRKLDPTLIINNRIDKHRDGMAGMNNHKEAVGDYGTPEQEIPATGFAAGVAWESCMTLNEHWGFNKHDQKWKSPTVVVRNLIDIVSKGGNYLLNVGPTAEGVIPDGSTQCLAAVGTWMKINQAAIHGSGASPFAQLTWGRCTSKPGKLFLHVFDWPKDGALVVPMTGTVTKASLLAQPGTALAVTTGKQGVTVILPAAAPDAVASVVMLDVTGDVQPINP